MSRRTLGFALLALSWSLWGLVFAVPWVDASTKAKVSIAAGLYGLSYAAFAGAVAVMGKEAWAQVKARMKKPFAHDDVGPSLPGPE